MGVYVIKGKKDRQIGRHIVRFRNKIGLPLITIEGHMQDPARTLENRIRSTCGRRCAKEFSMALVDTKMDSQLDGVDREELGETLTRILGNSGNRRKLDKELEKYSWTCEEIEMEIQSRAQGTGRQSNGEEQEADSPRIQRLVEERRNPGGIDSFRLRRILENEGFVVEGGTRHARVLDNGEEIRGRDGRVVTINRGRSIGTGLVGRILRDVIEHLRRQEQQAQV